ncbi:ribose-phosphate pyrophosphokinase [Microbacterium sp. 77mftsu3.1]|uniref:ribose-phosphate pyrophosphokinase n=1 Tax=Microbacterium sp. 77mftsu3.1 TaxID=1761802 RepID=UPI00036A4D16|nr:ribose-phosphate pyrophosphokinase [Microbacterium sp. 77mftsu3.1]SDH42827.1 ribose-phosphate pyrophosphokinase [Microbacterium sp. 77mftsu3.1]
MTITFRTRIGPGYITTPTFEAMTFPAGEAHIKVINDNADKGQLTEVARLYGADPADLFTAAMWADAARRRGARTVLHLPYLPAARADHADFVPLGAEVYAEFINSLHADVVVAFDPHSPVMPRMVRNLTVIDSTRLVREHVVGKATSDQQPQRYKGIIAPDKGAIARATAVADACHLPVYRAEKTRNPDTGKLSGFTCEPLPDTGRFLIVDDICDGGGTFAGLAAATGLDRSRLGLYVSHGVFSGQARDTLDGFGEIWTTDSFRPADEYDRAATAGHGIRANIIHLDRTLNQETPWL